MKVYCPRCKHLTDYENNPFRPFCSERCKMIDLGLWATEKYAVPTQEKVDKESQDDSNIQNDDDQQN